MKLTRRKLAAAVLGSSAAAAAQAPQPAEDEIKIARDRMRANSQALDSQKIAMSIEPAFQFKA